MPLCTECIDDAAVDAWLCREKYVSADRTDEAYDVARCVDVDATGADWPNGDAGPCAELWSIDECPSELSPSSSCGVSWAEMS